MQETIVGPRLTTAEEHAEGVRQAQVLFRLNHTMPYTDEYNALVKELFGVGLGKGGFIMPGLEPMSPYWPASPSASGMPAELDEATPSSPLAVWSPRTCPTIWSWPEHRRK